MDHLHSAALTDDLAPLVRRYRRANGPMMALVNRLGGSLEGKLGMIPAALRDRIEAVVAQALSAAYGLAARGAQIGPLGGPRGPLIAAMASGAAGGAGGIATSLAELPVTITVILHAIQREAVAAGFDPDDPAIRAECLQVFGAGSPLDGDEGGNTSFLSARLTLTGPTVQAIIARVAPKLAAAMGQKLVAQAVPVLGAVTGAGLNAAYLRYFTEMAAIRFGLLRLAEVHGAEPVMRAFAAAVQPARVRTARSS
ncbi:MAG: EcsC family protein [Pseudomonadota bacterium]